MWHRMINVVYYRKDLNTFSSAIACTDDLAWCLLPCLAAVILVRLFFFCRFPRYNTPTERGVGLACTNERTCFLVPQHEEASMCVRPEARMVRVLEVFELLVGVSPCKTLICNSNSTMVLLFHSLKSVVFLYAFRSPPGMLGIYLYGCTPSSPIYRKALQAPVVFLEFWSCVGLRC